MVCSAAKNPTPVRKRSEGEPTAGRSRPEENQVLGGADMRNAGSGGCRRKGGAIMELSAR